MFNILSQNRFVILSALVLFSALSLGFILPNQSVAQETTKPKLAVIELNDKTNNEDVLNIVEKLNPDLFVSEPGFGEPKHFARYIALDQNNKQRFIAVTVSDTGYFCTSFGCPTFIYQKLSNNQWKQALSVQSFGLYQDLNTSGNGPDNIITTSRNGAGKSVSVWVWNGQRYAEAKQK